MGFVQDIKDIKRFEQIIRVLFKHELGYFIERLRLKEYLTLNERLQKGEFYKRNTQPERIRLILEELGGAFVKLGQLLSLRPDLIPKEYCEEFSKLQDNVKPFPHERAKEIIEEELKKPIKEIFSEFNNIPIAAASIGQVYDAKLKTGERVVVKIQRPNIDKIFTADIDILYHLARIFEERYGKDIVNPVEIVDEFKSYTEDELDYVKEGKNVDKFYVNFMYEKKVRIPKVFWGHTTKKVLTLEFIEGKKLDQIKDKGYNKRKIVHNIVNAIFKQIFIDGVFHADPHPGNILVLEKNNIAFLDFGIVGSLDEELKEKISDLFITAVQGNAEEMAIALVNLKISDEDIDIEALKEDLRGALGEYFGVSLKQINLTDVFHKLIVLAKKDKIKLPVEFVLLGKCVITLESIATTFDPDFNIIEEGKPFVRKIIKIKTSPKEIFARIKRSTLDLKDFVMHFPNKTNLFLKKVKEADAILKLIDRDIVSLTIEMNRSSNRITISFILTGLIIAGALMMSYNEITIMGISVLSFVAFTITIILGVMLIISVLREKNDKFK
jgi:ubiquinone biosynthesis protein